MIHLAQYFPITDPTLTFFVVLLIILLAPIIMGKLRIPTHVAIIMDGNGRWATARGWDRSVGHQKGVETVRRDALRI